MKNKDSIYWIRQDLRLYDNPALIESLKNGAIIPIYILDDINAKDHKMGQASKIWLHHSLKKLNKQMNNNLLISRGNPENILLEMCKLEKIKNVFWNRVYEPWAISRDKKIKENFNKENIAVNGLTYFDIESDLDIGKVDEEYLFEVLSKINLEDSEALFVSCTALPVLSIIDKLEKKMNKVILSSNQTLIWESLNAIGYKNSIEGFGKLFKFN